MMQIKSKVTHNLKALAKKEKKRKEKKIVNMVN
jgi:hypothetical protein